MAEIPAPQDSMMNSTDPLASNHAQRFSRHVPDGPVSMAARRPASVTASMVDVRILSKTSTRANLIGGQRT
jgi:hypothetical protein